MTKQDPKKYTVKIHKEYIRKVREGLTIAQMNEPEHYDKLHENLEKANEYLINEIFWYTPEQIEELEQKEYEDILRQIEEIRNPKG